MLPASNSGAGMNIGFPDVCVTPVGPVPTPIPYPNMAMNAMCVPFAPNVLVSFVPGLNVGSEAPITLGDQAGALSPFMGPGRYTMGNPIVMINALPAINLLCPTTGNDMINALGAVMVPSITNVFYSHAGAAAPGRLTAGDLAGLSRALRPPGEGAETLLPGRVLHVSVPVFSAGVPARVYSAVRRVGASDVTALILDLRGCPGGEITAAIELAGDFLEEGAVIATATDGDGDETVHRARQGSLYRFPLFLLVDRRTASAAELFAGALQAHGRAVVVGERTYGKGSAQQVLASPDALYATVATFTLPCRDGGHPHTPGGEPIEGRGVRPDVEVPPDAALDALAAHLPHPSNEVP